ncbi:aminotransferase class IV [uncultured Sunxiuqinia sp.]|uniref:aminotransferase class IV n=1 Tax=uncultured Sunxiuqinia sp. TaxID=1573825 RepID=UPI002627E385|nr:aminotransferase class IV [uncultured Sunxiuqinia sp.]
MIGFDNGSYRNLSEISIPITSLSINRGYGAFEFLEVINGKPFYGDRHVSRFLKSMRLLKVKTNFDDRLGEVIAELIERNELWNGFIKLFALPHEAVFQAHYEASLYAFPTQMPDYPASFYADGVRLVLQAFDRFLPKAKSTNYLAGQYWMNEQSDPRVTDVLFHNGKTVQETSRGNLFVVKAGKVITPSENVLEGVTRGLVLEILKAKQLPFAEAELSLEELLTADEVFLSSTTKHIMPVTTLDDHQVADGKPGPITREVMEAFKQHKQAYGLSS